MMLNHLSRLGCLAFMLLVLLCAASSASAQAPPPPPAPPPCVAPTCWPGKFYKYDVIAQTGQVVPNAGTLGELGTGPSINDNGVVAFTGQFSSGNSYSSGIFSGDALNPLTWVTSGFGTPGTTFGDAVQINNTNQIVASDDILNLGQPTTSEIRIWNGNNNGTSLGSSTTIATGNTTGPFVSVLGPTAINKLNQAVFGGLDQNSGTIRVWGNNAQGELGNSSSTPLPNPVPTPVSLIPLAAGVTVKAIATGGAFSMALTTDGTVWAWGVNDYGTVGINPNLSPFCINGGAFNVRCITTPVKVSFPAGVSVVAIAAGEFHALALDSNGMVWAWGDNSYGELGIDPQTHFTDCSSTSSLACTSKPMRVAGLSGATAIAAGGTFLSTAQTGGVRSTLSGFSVALASGGAVWAWGNNDLGQLGITPAPSANCEVLVGGIVAKMPSPCSFTPVRIGLPTVQAISAGWAHILALASDGTVWAWGYNSAGQLGNGSASLTPSPTPAQVINPPGGLLSGVVAISAAVSSHSVALTDDGKVWAWGDNTYGESGVNPATSLTCTGVSSSAPCVKTPVQVSLAALPQGASVTAISAANTHSLVLTSNSTVFSWGLNAAGELGVKPELTPACFNPAFGSCSFTPVQALDPADLTGNLTAIGAIAGGAGYTMALHFNGLLLSAGSSFNQVPVTTSAAPVVDDNGNVLLRVGSNTGPNSIVLYNNSLANPLIIADNTNFNTVGMRPGISRDGTVVAFSGDLKPAGAVLYNTNPGPGIFVALISGGSVIQINRVAGFSTPYALGSKIKCPDPAISPAPATGPGTKCTENTLEKTPITFNNNWDGWCDPAESCTTTSEIETDAVLNGATTPTTTVNISFSTFDSTIFPTSNEWQSRIGVIHTNASDFLPAGAPPPVGALPFDGDAIIVSFLATPNLSSGLNFFTNQSGIWTVRVDLSAQGSGLASHVHKPIPVIQIGDLLGSPTESVASIKIYDPIAKASFKDAVGNSRIPNPEDHLTTFWVSTNLGNQKILRASHLDTDGDGIPDHVELYGMDFNGDGVIDLDLKTLDPNQQAPNPNHKDLYLEIDYMCSGTVAAGQCLLNPGQHTHHPNEYPLTGTLLNQVLLPPQLMPTLAVQNAFSNSPVKNPDGINGVNLHIIVDEAIPEVTPIVWGAYVIDSFDELKLGNTPCATLPSPPNVVGHFGSIANRQDANCVNIIGARRLVSRYAIFSHQFSLPDKPKTSTGYTGVAQRPGTDFTISLAAGDNSPTPCTPLDDLDTFTCFAQKWGTSVYSEWADAVSGTLMHELGHTLGLTHDGGTPFIDLAPNYLSVMNHSYQLNWRGYSTVNFGPSDCKFLPGDTSAPQCRTNRPLNYSPTALPSLDENALIPAAGIGAAPGDYINYRVLWYRPLANPCPLNMPPNYEELIGAAGLPLDWNRTGLMTPPPFSADINKSCGSNRILPGHEDWSTLQYSFYGSPAFGFGSTIPILADQELTTSDILNAMIGRGAPVTLVLTLAGTGGGSISVSGGDPSACPTSCFVSTSAGQTVTLTATPSTGSSFAGWSGACSGTGTCTINAVAPGPISVTATFNTGATCGTLTISPASLAAGLADLTYPAVTFNATGGVGTVTFTESGALPTGITFSNGTLSGTPTQTGSFPFTVTATDSSGCTGMHNYTLTITQSDTTPPVTTAVPSPGPNANGWNNTNVTVTLNSTDREPNGTGVKQIAYTATGAQPIASTVVTGGSTSFTISTEGITTINFFGTDNAGNIEAVKTITVKLDKTPPSIIGSRTPGPNQNGWNNTDVTVSFSCSDSLSGLAPGSLPANRVVSTEAAGQTVTGTCTDLAGNSASTTVANINIDKTPPILTVTSTPLPNGNGWNNTDVTVSFAAVDTLSGVAVVSAPVAVTTEGAGQVVTGSATDLAGNLAVGKVIVNVDKTAPEAFVQFDPVTKDVVLFGRDALSGVAPGPVPPTSVQPALMDDEDEDNRHARSKEQKRPDDRDSQAEIRTYKVFDLAGNSLVLVEKVRKEERQISARILTLQYGDGPVITLPRNQESFEWEVAKDGSLRELRQEFRTGRSEEDPRFEASFRSRKNETIILQEEPEPRTKTIKPGLDLLKIATARGKLTIEF